MIFFFPLKMFFVSLCLQGEVGVPGFVGLQGFPGPMVCVCMPCVTDDLVLSEEKNWTGGVSGHRTEVATHLYVCMYVYILGMYRLSV